MSLNNIRINTQLLTQLYAHSLLEAAPSQLTKTSNAGELMAGIAEKISPTTIAAAEEKTAAPTKVLSGTSEAAVAYGNTPHLGGNSKNILILVNSESAPYLPDAELEFLSSILSACKLSIADVAIVNLHRHPQSYTDMVTQFNSRQVLLFDVSPQQIDLPFNFPHFQLQQFDKRTYLSAQRLAEMAGDKEAKMQLWSCLKAMFGV